MTQGIFSTSAFWTTFFDDMWRSLNGGQSWAHLGPATGGDKQWFTIDKTNGMGHGFQYQFWSTAGNNYGGRQFSRSTDGGVTWMNPINHSQLSPYGERSTWTPTAISLSAAVDVDGASFGAFARPMQRTGASHQLLTKVLRSTSAAA